MRLKRRFNVRRFNESYIVSICSPSEKQVLFYVDFDKMKERGNRSETIEAFNDW